MADRRRFALPGVAFPLLLGAVTLLAYGLLFPFLGFYWDEWPMTWIAHRLGGEGLARYFATNRPYWGMIYRLTTPLLGAVPWHWQVFGLFWRWTTAVGLWGTLRAVWPRRADAAAFASLLFLVFPGFGQQSIGMMYGHFFVVLSAYLFSLWFNVLALRSWKRSPARFWLFSGLGLALALLNLMAMEYFFLLELARPLFLLAALKSPAEGEPSAPGTGRQAEMRRALGFWLPYLGVFLGAGLWRAFFFPYQTQNYRPGLLAQLAADPLRALGSLAATVLGDLFQVTLGGWARAVQLPDAAELGARTLAVRAAVMVAAAAAVLLFWLVSRRDGGEAGGRQPWAFPALGIGALALLVAGPPFWLTELPVTLDYPNDRFTLPFMLGSSLIFAGLLGLLPGRRVYKIGVLAVLVGLAAGLHFERASAFRRDWNMHRALFWQMSWRMPALQPGTTLLSSDLPLKYFSDNSLAGPLNWVYAPDNHSTEMSFMFYYASVRSDHRALLEQDEPIFQNYLASTFTGSTGRMVVLVYHPPACLRMLDPDLDSVNPLLPELMRDAAKLSDTGRILAQAGSTPPDLTPAIFGSEPARGWCYYFEQAELARQQGDWGAVVELGEQAFATGDYPNDPMERVPFIEGYAHAGKWARAVELSREAAAITPLMQPPLCRLWQRIEAQIPASAEKDGAASELREEWGCPD